MNFWDQRYQTQEYIYGTAPNGFLVDMVHMLPSGRVLCLGAGEGRNAVYLAQQGYEVTAVDGSTVGLQKAQQLARQHQVSITTVVADLSTFVIEPGYWQGMVSIFCHLPSAIRRPLYQRVQQGLAPGGVFINESFTPDQLGRGTGGPSNLDMLVSLAQLQEELAGLRLEIGRETLRDISEGNHHNGNAAVVQVVARRQTHE